jgi:hypothetical protein
MSSVTVMLTGTMVLAPLGCGAPEQRPGPVPRPRASPAATALSSAGAAAVAPAEAREFAGLRELAVRPAVRVFARGNRAIVSGDGMVVVAVFYSTITQVLRAGEVVPSRDLTGHASSLAAIRIRTTESFYQPGFWVYSVPGLEEVYDAVDGRDPHYLDGDTIVFHVGAQPMELDIPSQKVRKLGKPIAEFGCVDGFGSGGAWEDACPSRKWTRVKAIAADGRWLVEDVRSHNGYPEAVRLRAVRVGDAPTATTLLDVRDDATGDFETVLAPDGAHLCLAVEQNARGWAQDVRCGPKG